MRRLDMALPQPVPHGKAGEQVGAGLGVVRAWGGGGRDLGYSGMGGHRGKREPAVGAQRTQSAFLHDSYSTHTLQSPWPEG